MSIHCSLCGALLGTKDNKLKGMKLHKSEIAVMRTNDLSWESYPSQMFASAMLLDCVEDQISRRFALFSEALECGPANLLVCVSRSPLPSNNDVPALDFQSRYKVFYVL